MEKQEYWALYDENLKPLNKLVPRYTPLSKDEYELGVHIWIKIGDKFLIFKRSASKKLFPNYYEMIGGGIDGYDEPLATALREVEEESGLKLKEDNLEFMFMSKINQGEHGITFPEHTYVYMAKIDNLKLEDIRIEEGKNCNPSFKTKEEILNLIKENKFIPVVQYEDKIEKLF